MVMSLRKKKMRAEAGQPGGNLVPVAPPPADPRYVVSPTGADGVSSNGVGARRTAASYGDNIDPQAIQYGRDYVDWLAQRQQSGAGFAPIPQPIASYREERDPETGDYTQMSYGFDYAGVPTPVANVMRLSEPELNRQTSALRNQMNGIRSGVRSQGAADNPELAGTVDAFTRWYNKRNYSASAGFAPVPQPTASYHEERDPVTGDYKNIYYGFDYAGVPDQVADIMRLTAPELNRQVGSQVNSVNAIRSKVRDSMPIESQKYQQPRVVQTLDPTNGKSTFEIRQSDLYKQFFGDPFLSY